MARYTAEQILADLFLIRTPSGAHFIQVSGEEKANRIAAALNKAELFDEMWDALADIARQETSSEMDDPESGSFIEGFDTCVSVARAILAKVNEQ